MLKDKNKSWTQKEHDKFMEKSGMTQAEHEKWHEKYGGWHGKDKDKEMTKKENS